jgi:hypothetical protein
MASIVSAGTTSATALNMSADTTGVLQLASNNGTVALTVSTGQNVGVGTASPSRKFVVSNAGAQGFEFGAGVGSGSGNELLNYNRTTSLYVPLQTYASEYSFYSGTAGNLLPLFLSSSGNVGVNELSPTERLQVAGSIRVTSNAANFNVLGGQLDWDGTSGTRVSGYVSTGSNIQFYTNASGGSVAERMRISAEGNVGIGGVPSSYKFHIVDQVDRAQNTSQISISGSGYQGFHFLDGSAYYIGQNSNSRDLRIYSGGSTAVGVRLTPGNNAWLSYSDERMKDIIEPIENALAKVLTLRTVIGKYKTDEADKRRVFMIAQDVKAVLPEATTEDADGMLGMAYDHIVPLLTAAVKELSAQVTALQAKVGA